MSRFEIGAIAVVIIAGMIAGVFGVILANDQKLCTNMCGPGNVKTFVAPRPGVPSTCECK